jgi:Asp/Glu/hydantoin racemase
MPIHRADGRSLSSATKILVLNPNSSEEMTKGISTVIASTKLAESTQIDTYTAPSTSPGSINNGDDINDSATAVLQDHPDVSDYDAILVACYSVHPLVSDLRTLSSRPPQLVDRPAQALTGIFEGSILTALALVSQGERWGIITTGKFWEQHLADGVKAYLGYDGAPGDLSSRFAGVESTGMNASDFHQDVDPVVVTDRIKSATRRLLAKGQVRCIVMGCAGMAGLESTILEVAHDYFEGDDSAYRGFHVVDPVRASLLQLETRVRYLRSSLRDG